MKLYDCDCEFSELTNEASTAVKGYTLTSECDVCKAKREAQAQAKADADTQEEARAEAKEALLVSGTAKLKALGFTDQEIQAFLVGV